MTITAAPAGCREELQQQELPSGCAGHEAGGSEGGASGPGDGGGGSRGVGGGIALRALMAKLVELLSEDMFRAVLQPIKRVHGRWALR